MVNESHELHEHTVRSGTDDEVDRAVVAGAPLDVEEVEEELIPKKPCRLQNTTLGPAKQAPY